MKYQIVRIETLQGEAGQPVPTRETMREVVDAGSVAEAQIKAILTWQHEMGHRVAVQLVARLL